MTISYFHPCAACGCDADPGDRLCLACSHARDIAEWDQTARRSAERAEARERLAVARAAADERERRPTPA